MEGVPHEPPAPEQTPVSGSSSSTCRAASQSPNECSDNRAYLLIACECEKGWRRSIAFHTHDVEVLLWVREFIDSVWWTVPQLCTFGSINGASATGLSTLGSSATRSSRKSERSGAKACRCNHFINRTNAFLFTHNHDSLVRRESASIETPVTR